jgi:hypothetical protein
MGPSYELLNGDIVDLSGIGPEARAYLDELERDAAAGRSWAELVTRAKGPGAYPTRRTGGTLTTEVLADPVYRVAADIATRVGIAQGKVGVPRK